MKNLTGVLLVDKAGGPTSHDVVQAVRLITGESRCGHTGTLDPFATGLLPLCLGRATRLARFVSGAVKTYSATVRFGFATDTYDATGRPVGRVAEVRLDPETLSQVLASFVGRQDQVPPPFAAKKVRGQRMYRLARAGIPVQPRPVTVVIRRISLLATRGDRVTLDVEVESGTYIRSLAHDLGRRLGLGAHLEELRRTRVGSLRVEQAFTLERLEALGKTGRLLEAILDPSEALCDLPSLQLSEEGAVRVSHGRAVFTADVVGKLPELQPAQPCRLLGPTGAFLGIGMAGDEPSKFRPLVVLHRPSRDQLSKASVHSGFTG